MSCQMYTNKYIFSSVKIIVFSVCCFLFVCFLAEFCFLDMFLQFDFNIDLFGLVLFCILPLKPYVDAFAAQPTLFYANTEEPTWMSIEL